VATSRSEREVGFPEFVRDAGKLKTGATGLEPAASGVTGRRSNQLSYAPEGGGPEDRVRARPVIITGHG
jgi:hypothetical protein